MRIREYTRLLTNTSLFLSVFYPEREAAQRFARKLANDAVELFEIDAVTVKKLLPQYFE